jgi:SAM-dependent methyltransferase
MTLRIPDDEVARPSKAVPSASPSPPSVAASGHGSVGPLPAVSAPPITAQRIINLRADTPTKQIPISALPDAVPQAPIASPISPAPPVVSMAGPVSSATVPSASGGVPPRPLSIVPPPSDEDTSPRAGSVPAPPRPHFDANEDSWTPFQPLTADNAPPDSVSSVDIPIDSGSFDAPDSTASRLPIVTSPAALEPARELPQVAPVGAAPPAPPPSAAPPPSMQELPSVIIAPSPPPPPVAPAPVAASSPVAVSPAPPAAKEGVVGVDGFPEMVFDDDLFPSSQRTSGPSSRPVASGGGGAFTAPAAEPPPPAELAFEDRVTSPRLPAITDEARGQVAPAAPPPRPPRLSSPGIKLDLPPPRPRSVTTLDADEIAVDSEPSSSAEPIESSEISPEDVVSVEAVADKGRSTTPSAPPPPMRPRASSIPSIPPPPPAAFKVGRASSPSFSTATIRTSPAPDPNVSGGPPSKHRPGVIVPSASPLAPPAMGDAAAARKRTRPWWEELFNDDFIRTMAKISDPQIAKEVDFIEESLGLDKGAMVLDLACGTGRHAIELTRRGYQVVGFDLSLSMLAKAADEAQDRHQKLNFVQGDMREMTFDGTFDGVYCWSTSFGFFEEEKNAAVIANVRRALKPGGQLLLDVVNRDFVAQASPSLMWFEGDGCVCMDDMSIDWITSRMKVKRTMMMDDGRSREIEYSIRLYTLHELGKLLHDNGFRVSQVSGLVATPGVFFGANSPRTLILAEKK